MLPRGILQQSIAVAQEIGHLLCEVIRRQSTQWVFRLLFLGRGRHLRNFWRRFHDFGDLRCRCLHILLLLLKVELFQVTKEL